jgi:hypothetical protein
MATFISDAQRAVLNDMFTRMMRENGLTYGLPFQIGDRLAGGSVDGSVQVWVDPTNGNDENDGLQGRPFRTLTRATREIHPALINGGLVIHLKAGVYTDRVNIAVLAAPNSGTSMGASGATVTNTGVVIIGDDWVDATLATGSVTGQVASAVLTNNTCIVTAVASGWTTANLQGKFVQFTSGPLSVSGQRLYPIYTNTSNTFELAVQTSANIANMANATFKIVSPGAILRPANGPGTAGINIASSGSQGLTLANVHVDMESQNVAAVWLGGHLTCLNTSWVGGLQPLFFSPGGFSAVNFTQSYANASSMIASSGIRYFSSSGSVMITNRFHLFQLDFPTHLQFNGFTSIVEVVAPGLGGSGTAIIATKGAHSYVVVTAGLCCKNADYFWKGESGSCFLNVTGFPGSLYIAQTQFGAFNFYDDIIGANGYNSLCLYNTTILNSPYAMSIQTSHNMIKIIGSNISGCSNFALQIGAATAGVIPGKLGGFNDLLIYNTTMVDNGGAGQTKDISLDGTTFISKAAAVAATNGITIDAIKTLNRVTAF